MKLPPETVTARSRVTVIFTLSLEDMPHGRGPSIITLNSLMSVLVTVLRYLALALRLIYNIPCALTLPGIHVPRARLLVPETCLFHGRSIKISPDLFLCRSMFGHGHGHGVFILARNSVHVPGSKDLLSWIQCQKPVFLTVPQ